MVRMVQRRLIIPRGDTGSFSIPLLTTIAAGDVAVFSIYDMLTHNTVFEKEQLDFYNKDATNKEDRIELFKTNQ